MRNTGFVKVIADKENGKVLNEHSLHLQRSSLMEGVIAVKNGLTVGFERTQYTLIQHYRDSTLVRLKA